ncbi:hypothetical protein [Ornithinimicrobium kibberense]
MPSSVPASSEVPSGVLVCSSMGLTLPRSRRCGNRWPARLDDHGPRRS